ncbi:MAG: hypothetical protein LBI92_03350 [Azoarcus sp.]|jgi:hypothetical protein|nr:hypothetical protein [Azoarcus sp.]
MNPKTRLPVLAAALALAFCLVAPARAERAPAAAAPAASTPAAADLRARFKKTDLVQLVPASRTGGMRAIFEPKPVSFRARLAQLPSPQKAEYLKKVMGMMGADAELEVEQRVVLDYGGDKPLAAYVEKQTAARIGAELKAGDARTFYAFHVYNNRYGPALVITSFEEVQEQEEEEK